MLLSGKFKEPKMIQSNIDHGVFVWDYQGQQVYLSLATDDMVFASQDHTPFLYLKAELEKMFDLTFQEGNILKFLNL